jgi:anthranilate synthase component 1
MSISIPSGLGRTESSFFTPLRVVLPSRGLSEIDLFSGLRRFEPAYIWQSSLDRRIEDGLKRHRAGRFSFVGLKPRRSIIFRNGSFSVLRSPADKRVPAHLQQCGANVFSDDEDPFSRLTALVGLGSPEYQAAMQAAGRALDLPEGCGAAFGIVGYDTARFVENISGLTHHPLEPDMFFVVPEVVLALDHQEQELQLIAWPDPADTTEELLSTRGLIAQIAARAAELEPATLSSPSKDISPFEAEPLVSRERFTAAVLRAQEYIRAGDIFQLVLSNRLVINADPDPVALYDALRTINPSPYHFLLRFGSHTIVGASPEMMLRGDLQSDGSTRVSMRLVAGTYPAHPDDGENVAGTILADSKERAEHIMLVDHVRNDIGRVASIGSVRVDELFSVESYANVHHLVSQVSGTLPAGVPVTAALRSAFPIATLTGTPKIRAMEILVELEGPSRGFFGGAVVSLGRDGSCDSTVAIRCITAGGNRIEMGVGAGIVMDSVPEREYEECLWKGNAMLRAISAAMRKLSTEDGREPIQ